MKRILIIIISFISISLFAQRENTDTLFTSTGAIDTTVYRIFKRSMAYFELDITTFSDNDTVDIGYSIDKTYLGSVPGEVVGGSSIVFPCVLDVSDWTKTVNGEDGEFTKARIGIVGISWNAKYVAIDCKCGSSGCTPVLCW